MSNNRSPTKIGSPPTNAITLLGSNGSASRAESAGWIGFDFGLVVGFDFGEAAKKEGFPGFCFTAKPPDELGLGNPNDCD